MKNKNLRFWLCLLMCFVLGIGVLPAGAQTDTSPQAVYNDILALKQPDADPAAWIGGELTQTAGTTAEWYALALSQSGNYSFDAYEAALLGYLEQNPVYSATSRQKYALVLSACGSTDPYIYNTLNDSIGIQGLMSWVYGLHLLNNGYAAQDHTVASVTQKLLSLQLSDGGWAILGQTGDVDATAMALQALAPYATRDTVVQAAIDKGVALLSSRQQSDGGFTGMGVPNPESGAQVLIALSALGIDGHTDSRFVKNGNSVLDGILLYRLPDGSFCHTAGGVSNQTATSQVFCAMAAYLRMLSDKPGLYLLDHADPTGTGAPQSEPSAPGDVASQPDTSPVKAGGYKVWVTLALALLALGTCGVLYLCKRRNIRNLIMILAVAALLMGVTWMTDLQSTSNYYGTNSSKENAIGVVTISIRCDTVAGQAAHIPADGWILAEEVYEIEAGDTVYDILKDATVRHKLHLEVAGTADSVYVEGINNLYEFEYGELSGWMYFVNGIKAEQSCSAYPLADGDIIQWRYTRTMGGDLK